MRSLTRPLTPFPPWWSFSERSPGPGRSPAPVRPDPQPPQDPDLREPHDGAAADPHGIHGPTPAPAPCPHRSSAWSVTIAIRLSAIAYPRARYRSRSPGIEGASTYSSRSVIPSSTGRPVPAKFTIALSTEASFPTICSARHVAPSETKFSVRIRSPPNSTTSEYAEHVSEQSPRTNTRPPGSCRGSRPSGTAR
ncbi:hypothetical protein DSECCO2_413340 [anaerobic digester metagenome]